MKRIILFGGMYGIILLIAFIYRESIIDWLNAENHNYVFLLPWLFLLSLFISIIPVIPFAIFSGLMGMKYGVWLGAFINWVGSIGAAALFFLLARYYFVDLFQTYISKYKQVKKFDQIISHNAFFAVFFSRMIPFIPTPVINIYSGLSSMLFVHYFAATAIGQIPTMIVYAYLGNQLFVSIQGLISGILIYIGFVLLVIPVYRFWYKKA